VQDPEFKPQYTTKKKRKIMNIGEHMRKLEPSYNVGGNVT
jgi:hypothetical protein